MMDERCCRMWTFYLAGATAAFESGGMGNYQIQFPRSRHALPLTRDYMAEAEAAYLSPPYNRASARSEEHPSELQSLLRRSHSIISLNKNSKGTSVRDTKLIVQIRPEYNKT